MLKRIILLILLTIPLTGCASTGRVHDKQYLRCAVISGNETKTLTLSFFTDEDSVISVTADDIDDALEQAELKCGMTIFTGYTELVVLDDTDALDTLVYLLKEWKVSPSCLVTKGSAEVLKNNSAEVLAGSVKRSAAQGKSPESDLITALSELLDKDCAEVASITPSGASGTAKLKSSS